MMFLSANHTIGNSVESRIVGTLKEMSKLASELFEKCDQNFVWKGLVVVSIAEIDAKGGYRKFNARCA